MAWVISVLGAALALGGGYALWSGSTYIRLDWGQAETVAGTVAMSAGIVTVALAAVLFKLRDLARAPARVAAARVAPETAGLRGDAVGGRGDAEPPTAPVRLAEAAGPSPAARTPPVAPAGGTGGLPPSPAVERAPEPAAARALPVPEAPRPAAVPAAEAPTVVGRYEANGASYVLFSDGTIEVETEAGTHRFDSMAHLKDHIERQDAG